MQEVWKDIEGYEGLYQVSNLGRIKSLCREGCFLGVFYNRKGYARCRLYKDGKGRNFRVHRLVAMTFIPNPDNKPEVNHIDGNKRNNCVTNLEWVTSSENHVHAYVTGLRKRRGNGVLQYDLEGNFIAEFPGITEAARVIGKPSLRSSIGKCCNGDRITTGNFIWRFKDREILKHIDVDLEPSFMHPVLQYDLEGNFLAEFPSITNAAVSLGKPSVRASITKCCLGKNKTSLGYVWKYKD